jgi:serine/threonine protein kinase
MHSSSISPFMMEIERNVELAPTIIHLSALLDLNISSPNAQFKYSDSEGSFTDVAAINVPNDFDYQVLESLVKYAEIYSTRDYLSIQNQLENYGLIKNDISLVHNLSEYELCVVSLLLGLFPFARNLNNKQGTDALKDSLHKILDDFFHNESQKRKSVTSPAIKYSPNQSDIRVIIHSKKSVRYDMKGTNTQYDQFFDMKKTQGVTDLLITSGLLPEKDCPVYTKYEVINVLGKGSYGLVLKAIAKSDPKKKKIKAFAIKFIMFEDKYTDTKAQEYGELRLHRILTSLYSDNGDIFTRYCNIIKLYDWVSCIIHPYSLFHYKHGKLPLDRDTYHKYIEKKFDKINLAGEPTQILLLELASKNSISYLIRNDPKLFFSEKFFSACMAQNVAPLWQLQSCVKFVHGDYHTLNILSVFDKSDNLYLYFTINDNEEFYIPLSNTTGLIFKMNDFGFSRLEFEDVSEKHVILTVQDFQLGEGRFGRFNRTYDMHKLCCEISEHLFAYMRSGMLNSTHVSDTVIDFLSRAISTSYLSTEMINYRKNVQRAFEVILRGGHDDMIFSRAQAEVRLLMNSIPDLDEVIRKNETLLDLIYHELFNDIRIKPGGINPDITINMDCGYFSQAKEPNYDSESDESEEDNSSESDEDSEDSEDSEEEKTLGSNDATPRS